MSCENGHNMKEHNTLSCEKNNAINPSTRLASEAMTKRCMARHKQSYSTYKI